MRFRPTQEDFDLGNERARAQMRALPPPRPLNESERYAVAVRRAADPTSILDEEPEFELGGFLGLFAGLKFHVDPALGKGLIMMTPQGGSGPPILVWAIVDDPVPPPPPPSQLNLYAQRAIDFKRAMTDLASAFDSARQAVPAVFDADAARLNRRRHGHAVRCPVHGPTTGGLCRRCSGRRYRREW